MSNNISSTNSQEKLKRKIKFQNRNDRNNGTFVNYTQSCSYSTNNINNQSKTNNNLNSNKNTYVNNTINNKKIPNLKHKLVINEQYDASYNFILDNNGIKSNNKSPIVNELKKQKSNKSLKSFYNNNIKLIKKQKKEKLNNILGINHTILKEIKDKIYQNIKKSEIINDKNLKNNNTTIFNSVISVKKHR